MKKRKSIATIALTALLSLNMSVPAFADDTTAYTVEYSKVEQMVLGCNLQVNSNNFLLKSLDNESEMKEKYSQLSDMISKTSSSLTAIIGNPQASAELKTVAQGTNVALSTLSAFLDTQEDISDDDYQLKELQADLANYQLVRTAQSLFSVHYQLQYNLQKLTNTRAILQNNEKVAQIKYDLTLGTSLGVSQAKDALAEMDNSIAGLQSQSKEIDMQMNRLLGHSYGDSIIFGSMPDPDISYVNKIDLKKDTAAAQDASYNVQIKRKQRALLGDETIEDRERKTSNSNLTEVELQNIGASLEKQLYTIQKQHFVLVATQQKLETSRLYESQTQKKYSSGLMSSMEYDNARNDTFAQNLAVKIASAELFWEIESYKWIAKGLPAS
ncbi:hypothetical protein [Faecalispora anaeroviscerum]|uniref:hypothetical protein n=1 Tax=Faecalispora anaeroviscerum TaxID=2991836 RepID=UPI0024BAAC40|nr:hypothetical protein [Faecalispora anaeroviscerum]